MTSRASWSILMLGVSCTASIALAAPPPEGDTARVRALLSGLPLTFVENRGQVDGPVAYYAQGRETTLYLTPQGLTFALNGSGFPPEEGWQGPPQTGRWVVKLDLVGGKVVTPVGKDRTGAKVSYFKGSKSEWRTGLATFGTVVYPEVWPGIDLEVSGTASRLKSTFVVKPGADPKRIRLAYRGAESVKLAPSGGLEVDTPLGGIDEERPYAYQEIGGRRVEVAAAFALEAKEGRSEYGFSVVDYDPAAELVLDPATLVYCGYIGGSGGETGYAIAVDGAGSAYVAGHTYSSAASFPVTVGPDLTGNGMDGFVAKLRPDGSGLDYCGFIGGQGGTEAHGIAVDAAGNAYVTGFTSSTAATFPVTVGPDLTSNGGIDAFVAKVAADGSALEYCGYIGGASTDYGWGIAVDSTGSAYVTGQTYSAPATFPATVGPYLTYHNGGDAFVAKVRPDGSGLDYCGYVGGSVNESAEGIAVDTAGSAYITGTTESTEASFPVTVGPDLTYNGGSYDVFVAKVRANGSALDYCGYIGGSAYEMGHGITVDGAGSAFVTGMTCSSEATFPVRLGPDVTFNGGGDIFVAKVSIDGSSLDYCGYIGGNGSDVGLGIATDVAGNAYVVGYADSTEATFPVAVGPDLTYNGGQFDGVVAKVRADASGLDYCGYIGGSELERVRSVAVDATGNAYVTGETWSTEATFPVTAGPDLTFNSDYDAFVAMVPQNPASTDLFSDGFETGDTSAWASTVP